MYSNSRLRLALTGSAAAVIIAVLAIYLGWFAVRSNVHTAPPQPPTASQTSTDLPEPTWSATTPVAPTGVTMSWAYIESVEGTVRSGGTAGPQPIGALAVPAIVADYLDGVESAGATPSPEDTTKLTAAMRGDQDAIEKVTSSRGGETHIFARVIDWCQLTETRTGPTRMTALDVARTGACLREGAIVEPKLAGWVLDQMRDRAGGIGDIRGSEPDQKLAQQHSAVLHDGRWRAGCLAVGAWWSAAVLVDYPEDRGKEYALTVCADVARDAFPPDTQTAPAETSPPAPVTGA